MKRITEIIPFGWSYTADIEHGASIHFRQHQSRTLNPCRPGRIWLLMLGPNFVRFAEKRILGWRLRNGMEVE